MAENTSYIGCEQDADVRICRLCLWNNFDGFGFRLAKASHPPHFVSLIECNSPEAAGGLKIRDVILSVNDLNMEDADLNALEAAIKTSKNTIDGVNLLVMEQSSYKILTKRNMPLYPNSIPTIITPSSMPVEFLQYIKNKPRLCEMYLKRNQHEFGFDIAEGVDDVGIYIRTIYPNSLASRTELRESDRIIEINGQNVDQDSCEYIRKKLAKAKKKGKLKLCVADAQTYTYYITNKKKFKGKKLNSKKYRTDQETYQYQKIIQIGTPRNATREPLSTSHAVQPAQNNRAQLPPKNTYTSQGTLNNITSQLTHRRSASYDVPSSTICKSSASHIRSDDPFRLFNDSIYDSQSPLSTYSLQVTHQRSTSWDVPSSTTYKSSVSDTRRDGQFRSSSDTMYDSQISLSTYSPQVTHQRSTSHEAFSNVTCDSSVSSSKNKRTYSVVNNNSDIDTASVTGNASDTSYDDNKDVNRISTDTSHDYQNTPLPQNKTIKPIHHTDDQLSTRIRQSTKSTRLSSSKKRYHSATDIFTSSTKSTTLTYGSLNNTRIKKPSPESKAVSTKTSVNICNGTIQVYQGNLTEQKVDVIVVASTSDRLTAYVLREAGKSVSATYDAERQKSASAIICTNGGRLPCNEIYFIPRFNMSKNADKWVFRNFVKCAIEMATSDDNTIIQSIAFPAIGCGQYNCNPNFVAETLIRSAVYELKKRPSWKLNVNFVIQQHQQNVLSAFQNKLKELQSNQSSEIKIPVRTNENNLTLKLSKPHKRPIDRSSSEYTEVMNKFWSTMTKHECKEVVKVELVWNECWYKQYQIHRNEFYQRLNNDTEQQLFHGCSETAANNIMKGCFNRSYAGVHGVLFGHGVYFSSKASYSHSYAPVNTKGERCMFLARVLVGKTTIGNSSTKVCPIGYDTTTNGSHIYVTYHDAQSFGQYIITYK